MGFSIFVIGFSFLFGMYGSLWAEDKSAGDPAIHGCEAVLELQDHQTETMKWLRHVLEDSGIGEKVQPFLDKKELSGKEAMVLSLLTTAYLSNHREGISEPVNAEGWIKFLEDGTIPQNEFVNSEFFLKAAQIISWGEGKFKIHYSHKSMGVVDFERWYGKPVGLVSNADDWGDFDGGWAMGSPLFLFVHDLGHAQRIYETFWKDGDIGSVKQGMFDRWVEMFWGRVRQKQGQSIVSGDYLRVVGFLFFRDGPDYWNELKEPGYRPFLRFMNKFQSQRSNIIGRLQERKRDLGKEFPRLADLSWEQLEELHLEASREFGDVFLSWIQKEGGLAKVSLYFPAFQPSIQVDEDDNAFGQNLIKRYRKVFGEDALGKRLKALEQEIFGK